MARRHSTNPEKRDYIHRIKCIRNQIHTWPTTPMGSNALYGYPVYPDNLEYRANGQVLGVVTRRREFYYGETEHRSRV